MRAVPPSGMFAKIDVYSALEAESNGTTVLSTPAYVERSTPPWGFAVLWQEMHFDWRIVEFTFAKVAVGSTTGGFTAVPLMLKTIFPAFALDSPSWR
jgi:hypothetical protein